MNDIEILKTVADSLAASGRAVSRPLPGVDTADNVALAFTEAAARLQRAAAEIDDLKTAGAEHALRAIGITPLPLLQRHLTHLIPKTEDDPMVVFTLCCGYNWRHLADSGDLVTSDKSLASCQGRDHVNLVAQARAEQASYEAEAAQRGREAATPNVRYTMALGLEHDSPNGWQRLAMVLIARLDDLTHAVIEVSDADLMGVDGLNACWSRNPATDKTVYWLEDPAREQ